MNTQNFDDDVSEPLSEQDLKESAEAECEEMLRYRQRLSEQLGHDPEDDRPAWEINVEWIDRHAAEFRRNWRAQRRDRPPP
ncbi:MAG TPA: hypothetical protein VMC06_00390 [Opitutaceae bacterium]|nr:hypothetical protein [Opitutaceae bacterium]